MKFLNWSPLDLHPPLRCLVKLQCFLQLISFSSTRYKYQTVLHNNFDGSDRSSKYSGIVRKSFVATTEYPNGWTFWGVERSLSLIWNHNMKVHSMTINKRDLACLQEYDCVILPLPFTSSQCNLPSRPSYGRPQVVLHDMTLRSTICHLQLPERLLD